MTFYLLADGCRLRVDTQDGTPLIAGELATLALVGVDLPFMWHPQPDPDDPDAAQRPFRGRLIVRVER